MNVFPQGHLVQSGYFGGQRTIATAREAVRDYRLQNQDSIKEYTRHYYLQNEDKKKLYDRRYYAQHEDKKKEYARQRYLLNEDKAKEYYLLNKNHVKEVTRRYRLLNHKSPETYLPRASPTRSWKSPENVREYFDSIAKQLHITSHSDWYRVSVVQLAQLGGKSLYRKFHSIGGALQYAYPEISWDQSKFSFKGKKSVQMLLKGIIEELLPSAEILEDFQHPTMTVNSDRPVQLDLWLPNYQIGIEYQGEQHYYNLDGAFGPSGTASFYWERDLAKISNCQLRGITLVIIPFWWDRRKESLSATLYRARPDLFPLSTFAPIPSEIPLASMKRKLTGTPNLTRE